ncbi:hypothetical protein [Crassaminicella profunda]|uniref:hypothetical protein n=1 Tax=Crassaminicella profunda TaxID=1286698 RepID=UPI001CA6EEB0|nr:hypothetical protein [Crassaminicella profunda]QZY55889.1 hypothetical protein K7H06_02410 [Crassaminicella profunda]
MKNYKRVIALGLISAVMITTVACTGDVKDTASSTQVESTKEDENTQAEEIGYNFDKIYKNPEILKEFTKMDADYKAYLENEPVRAMFLDENTNLTDETDVYILKESEDPTALYLYIKEDKVINAKLDAFNGEVNTEGYDYDTLVYNYNHMEKQTKEVDFPYDLEEKREDTQKELKEKFEGKSLKELQDVLKVYTPLYRYMRKDTDKILETYMIISEAGYTASSTINVVVKDGKIEKLYIDDSYQPSNDPVGLLKEMK